MTIGESEWNGTDSRVALAEVSLDYDTQFEPNSSGPVRRAIIDLAQRLGWGESPANPFGNLVRNGDRVVVKPNWVLHENLLPSEGFDPLVTHGSIVRTVVDLLQRSSASEIVVGDAPVQGCDFAALITNSGLDEYFATARATDSRIVAPVDFRRTVSSIAGAVRTAKEDARDMSKYVLFDLATESHLEPITVADTEFRVTQYPPDLMKRTHSSGRHQYLVAREILDADVIVNLPKLKTHKKAGVTCALKNLVGINGNKEFLPHHRVGGPSSGGDCYPENSPVKRLLETVLDRQNTTKSETEQSVLGFAARALYSIANRTGDVTGVEGAWSGNDTVWRMCLDLNRIIQFGTSAGTIAPNRQRRVVNIVDAVVAGHGDGPLAPKALPLGILMAGENSAAVDWIGAMLLHFDPRMIPIVHNAFARSDWPLAVFGPQDIRVLTGATVVEAGRLMPRPLRQSIEYPSGWLTTVSTSFR